MDDLTVKDSKFATQLPLQGLNTDYAIQNKYILYCPISNALGKKYSDLELNLTRFSIPQCEIASMSYAFKGYSVQRPAGVIAPDTKQINFEYIIDADWRNYRALYLWTSCVGKLNPVSSDSVVEQTGYNTLDCRIWLLNQYKKRVMDLVFKGCWIQLFNELSLDYSQSGEIHHSFTMSYDIFELEDVAETSN